MNRGHVFLAQNSDVNYVRQAYALATSIKKFNKNNQTCLITNDSVPLEYFKSFDHIVKIPWGDAAHHSQWKIENRWKIIYATPFKYNLVYDTDMLVLSSTDHWWEYLEDRDVVLTSQVKTYRGLAATSDHYRKAFTANQLPNSYFGLHYFNKNRQSFEFYKWLEIVVKNWRVFFEKYTPQSTQRFCSIDVASAIVIKLMNAESDFMIDSDLPSFIHMKSGIQNWKEFSEDWQEEVPVTFDNQCRLKIANFLQSGVFHYTEDSFLTNDIITKLENYNV